VLSSLFRRTEEPLRRLELSSSGYVRPHLKFTPFPYEPLGWMIEQSGAELFMFSPCYVWRWADLRGSPLSATAVQLVLSRPTLQGAG